MTQIDCDVLIVGGGTGGCAAALATTSMGLRTVLTEETDWIGGQLTSQGVPPDEHPWIEQFGCTASYRAYRNGVRRFYRDHLSMTASARANATLNPGGGWVSKLCHEPRIGWQVLNAMLQPAIASQLLDLRLHTAACGACVLTDQPVKASSERPELAGDRISTLPILDLLTGAVTVVHAKYIIDATELGEILALGGVEHVIGAESKTQTAEPSALDGEPNPNDVQGITWVFAMGNDPNHDHTIDKPEQYDKWRAFQPPFWPGPLIGARDLNPQTLAVRELPFLSDDWLNFFRYRQIVDPNVTDPPREAATIVNWPMNDYFEVTTVGIDQATLSARLHDAKQLSLSLLYWLQTERGYRGLRLRPDLTGTADGFAKTPYIREARRIAALKTVREQDVATESHPGADRAPSFDDSVGIGAYRIDLHPSTSGRNYIDTSSLPFEIPLGSLVPIRMKNVLPACKNLGVTHITNGCYRLHPVEWNIGESAGYLAAYCLREGVEPQTVANDSEHVRSFQSLIVGRGVEIRWPKLRGL